MLNTLVGQTRRSRTIGAGQPAIWEVLADFGALSTWAGNVDHSCLLRAGSEPVGRTRRVQVGRLVLIERIVEFAPSSALAYDIEGLPAFAGAVRNRWELHPRSERSTEVTLTTTVDIGSRMPQRIAEQVIGRATAKLSDGLLTGLATHLEATHV